MLSQKEVLMPGRLLESGAAPRRSIRAMIPSLVVHGALIVIAVRATAHAPDLQSAPIISTELHFPIDLPPQRAISGGGAATQVATQVATQDRSIQHAPVPPTIDIPFPIDDVLPPPLPVVDHLAVQLGTITNSGIVGRGVTGFGPGTRNGPGTGTSPIGPYTVFGPSDVDRAVFVLRAVTPAYPEPLRAAGISGGVTAEFVVDTLGRTEPGSIRIIDSTDPLFSAAVIAALPKVRFAPAESNGRKVRQRVQQAFKFALR
jgi:TonB family protein